MSLDFLWCNQYLPKGVGVVVGIVVTGAAIGGFVVIGFVVGGGAVVAFVVSTVVGGFVVVD